MCSIVYPIEPTYKEEGITRVFTAAVVIQLVDVIGATHIDVATWLSIVIEWIKKLGVALDLSIEVMLKYV